MPEQRRSGRVVPVLLAGAVIGTVEVVLAVSFAALVFGGYVVQYLPNGIGLYLVAATLTLGILAVRAGARGVVGSVQDAAAAVLALVAASTAVATFGGPQRAFFTVVAATMLVTLLAGLAFVLLGRFRLGNLVRFVPYPVVGGFLAGTGWLLTKGGVGVAASLVPSFAGFDQLIKPYELIRWIPAVAFGLLLVVATRIVRRPLVIPVGIALGCIAFAIGMVVTGSSTQTALSGGWMLGPFPPGRLLQPWTFRALSGADWSAVSEQFAGIATTIFVAVIAALFNVSGTELMLHTDLDSNRELRDVGIVNVVSGLVGGIPGYHALSLTSLAQRLNVDARRAGLVAAIVPFSAVAFGAGVIELIPRMIVGGALVFVGLSLIVDWVIDIRRSLPLGEYAIVLAILATVVVKGLLPGVEVGLVLAVALFAVNYSRIDAVREVEFGSTYRSNVDRPSGEGLTLVALADHVQILRVSGFVFFGTATGLLDRIRRRVESGPLRFLLIDLRRVTGMDSSAVLSFRKVAQLAETHGFELVISGATDPVQRQLQRGEVVARDGIVRFEPDLDHGLQRCEDGLLRAVDQAVAGDGQADALMGLPARLWTYLERTTLPTGAIVIRQGEPPDDLFVLESGRLVVELTTPEGTRMRLRSMRSGVVVGEVAMYTGVPRTADVVAETPSVVLRLSRGSIERIAASDPELAAELHRWLAHTLAERLTHTMGAIDALLD